jgi:hypothetical protein
MQKICMLMKDYENRFQISTIPCSENAVASRQLPVASKPRRLRKKESLRSWRSSRFKKSLQSAVSKWLFSCVTGWGNCGASHKNGLQLFAFPIENARTLCRKSARPIKFGGLQRRIDKYVGEQVSGHHVFNVFEKCPAYPKSSALRRNIQKPDLIHIQPCNTQYFLVQFINCNIKEPSTLRHGLICFKPADFIAKGQRVGWIIFQAGTHQPAA